MKFRTYGKRITACLISAGMIASAVTSAGAGSVIPQSSTTCVHHAHTPTCGGLLGECTDICNVCKADVQNLINTLPDISAVTAQNKATVKASLLSIDAKMAGLTSATVATLDITKYNEASYAVNAPEGMAIGRISGSVSGYNGSMPKAEFTFATPNSLPVSIKNAADMKDSYAIIIDANGKSGYFYIPAGTYTVQTRISGSWSTALLANGVRSESLTVAKGQVFELNAVSMKLKKITRINTQLSDTSLLEYKATAPSVAAMLPNVVSVSLEDGASVDLPVVWNCDVYNASPGAQNTFVWSVPVENLKDVYDYSSVALTGSINVTNAAPIAVLNGATDTTIVYNGNDFDVATLFSVDVNSGTPTYELTGGSGKGRLSGSSLSIDGAGTFEIKLSTAANGAYASGEMSAVLTVAKAQGEGSVNAEDVTFDTPEWAPVAESSTNGNSNVELFYKPVDADDSAYSGDIPERIGTYSVRAVFAANDLYEELVCDTEFSITKGIPVANPDNPPAGKRVKKRARLSSSKVTSGEMIGADGGVVPGIYTWSEPEKVMMIAGMETAVFTPDSENYETVEVAVPVDVYSSYDSSSVSGTVTHYTVYFVTNGGTHISSVKVPVNQRLTEPDEPEKDGYIFDGWYTDQKLTKPYSFKTAVTKNLTLYAGWVPEDEEDDEDEDVIFVPSTPKPSTPAPSVPKPSVPEADTECGGTVEEGCRLRMFYDLDVNEWYHQSIDYVIRNGLMNGTGAHSFEPDATLTRAMLVTILYRAEGEPRVSGASGFFDVETGSYYEDAVIWAKYNNIVTGYTTYEFAPEDHITREQFAAIMYRYAIYKNYDVSIGNGGSILSYSDAYAISNYAVSAVQYAVGSGLMNGKTSYTLNPQDYATRAEAAAMLHRFMKSNN